MPRFNNIAGNNAIGRLEVVHHKHQYYFQRCTEQDFPCGHDSGKMTTLEIKFLVYFPYLHRLTVTIYEQELEQEDLSLVSCYHVIISGLPKVGEEFGLVTNPVSFFKGEMGGPVCSRDSVSVVQDVVYKSTVVVEEVS